MNQYLTAEVKRGATYYAVIAIVLDILGALLGIAIIAVPPLAFLACASVPLLCLVGLAIPVGIGWFVAQWSSSNDMSKGAMSGAFACGLGALIAGAVNFVLGLCVNVVTSSMGLQNAGDMVGALILGIGSGLIGWIIGAVFAAIFGAVGGLLYVAIQGNKAPRPA
jgi:hypothetical protein